MEPLEHIIPSQVKSFFTILCIVSSRHEKQYRAKYHAVTDLDNQLEKIKKFSKGKADAGNIPSLKSKISGVLEPERRIFGNKRIETAREKELFEKIDMLEHELQQAKQERDNALEQNKKQIHELNAALSSIKMRVGEFIEHKKEREERIMRLEKKIKRKAG